MQLVLSSARRQRDQASQAREQALAFREQGQQVIAEAMLLPEQSLTRGALYDRLRSLAVARAHALELQHAAGELNLQAGTCDEREREFCQQAAAHQRKKSKLEYWNGDARVQRVAAQQRRQQRHLMQEMICRLKQAR
ncbi:hypothetical protein OHC51_03675 [Stenotrophomonas indicatrix]|uniref:hypothetical protein n=1 Tax=Stenotrophomonas indicatrix TaxID=2045451 RepID=UPI00300938E0